jgi:hypothetical protein
MHFRAVLNPFGLSVSFDVVGAPGGVLQSLSPPKVDISARFSKSQRPALLQMGILGMLGIS